MPAPSVEYVDKLDVIEDKVFASIPPSARLLLGLLGMPAPLE
ncbi:MAG: hypothetical protein NTV43_01315 [Methylococcales bacterium]|nr:hypothetical protein [Methylococcales bacterium]